MGTDAGTAQPASDGTHRERPVALIGPEHSPETVWPGAGAPGEGVIDAGTFEAIEGERLFEALDRTRTRVGRAALRRSLLDPPTRADAVRARQEAVAALRRDAALRTALADLLERLATAEGALYELLYGEFVGTMGTVARPGQVAGAGYRQFLLGTRFLRTLVVRAARLPTPDSSCLRALLARIAAFGETRAWGLARGPVHVTWRGLFTDEDRPRRVPGFRFRAGLLKPGLLSGAALAAFAVWHYVAHYVTALAFAFHPLFLVLAPAVVVYAPAVAGFDRDSVILPLRDELRCAPALHAAMEALATLDELLALAEYAEAVPGDCVQPEIVDADHHHLELVDARHPVAVLDDPAYVGNDADLGTVRLTLITGPNSGGKTAFCKTVVLCQLLAQTGAFVPARRARMSVAERIAYQVPEAGRLSDGEGRFASELRRTRAIFFAATRHSLVVLDELSEGTTFEEKMAVSEYILEGFLRLRASTLLVTHNHQLCDRLAARAEVRCRQAEFIDGRPTHRLIDGISRVSHADRVAARVGFSAADIERHPGLAVRG